MRSSGPGKTTSTPVSAAALLQPASTIDQNVCGLLLTKATFGLPDAVLVEPPFYGVAVPQPMRTKGRTTGTIRGNGMNVLR